MYSLIKTIGVRKGINKRWEVISNDLSIKEMFDLFRKVQVNLLPPQDTVVEYLDLDNIAAEFSQSEMTVSQMLASIGNRTLVTSQTGIVLRQSRVRFMDAYRAGYRAMAVDGANRNDPTKPLSLKPNLRLTSSRDLVDYYYMHRRQMVSVNGLFHMTDTDSQNGLMVYDASASMQLSSQSDIGLLSFTNMCDISQKRIAAEQLNSIGNQTVRFTLDQDMTGRSMFLVFAGYLVFVDGQTLKRVGDSEWRLDLSRLNLAERYFELQKYIDVSKLDIVSSVDNPDLIAVEDLASDTTIPKWFKLSQTFAVILECPEIYTQSLWLDRTGTPGAYFSHVEPSLPVVLELGRCPSYWSEEEDGRHRLSLYNNFVDNELYYSMPLPKWINTSGSNDSGRPRRISKAYFLEIGRDR